MEQTAVREKTLYEIMLAIVPDIAADALNEKKNSLVSLLEKHGANIHHSGDFEKKQLAYPIKKNSQGYLGAIQFWADHESIAGINRAIVAEKYIMRAMLSKKTIMLGPQRKSGRRRDAEQPSERATSEAEQETERKMRETKDIKEERQEPKRERKEKISIEEIDKKLNEIMGNL